MLQLSQRTVCHVLYVCISTNFNFIPQKFQKYNIYDIFWDLHSLYSYEIMNEHSDAYKLIDSYINIRVPLRSFTGKYRNTHRIFITMNQDNLFLPVDILCN
jgi:hypothetical protein